MGEPWLEAVAFYLLAALTAGFALGCVIASSIVRMAMCLLGALGTVALLYFLLAASFLGVVQLIVYAGGTLVVIVFGIMLTSRAAGPRLKPRAIEVAVGAVVFILLLAGLTAILLHAVWTPLAPDRPPPSVAELGQALLGPYLVPFEVVSVLLLAVMIGAAYLAQPEARRKDEG